METMTLAKYYDLLDKHDWYYEYSDDNSVWRQGLSYSNMLIRISNEKPEYKEMYLAFKAHHYSGKPWPTEQSPKPNKPIGE